MAEETKDAAGPSFKGFLTFQSDPKKDWIQKYVALYDIERCLIFYTDEAAFEKQGSRGKLRVNIGDETVAMRTASVLDPATPHVFTVMTESSVLWLCAESSALRDSWCDHIDAVVSGSEGETSGALILATPSKGDRKWSLRWCVLHPGKKTLAVYKKKAHVDNASKKPHIVELTPGAGRIEEESQMEVGDPITPHLFQLTQADKCYVFCVQSEPLRERWIYKMRQVLQDPARTAQADAVFGAATSGGGGGRRPIVRRASTMAAAIPQESQPQRWDICIAFSSEQPEDPTPEQAFFTHARVVAQLEDAGLWVKSFLSTAKDEIYVKVAGPTSRLLKEADRTEYSLALDEHVIERLFREGDESLGRDPLEIKRKTGLEAVFFKRNPWQDIYGRYNPDADPSLYQKYENGTCLSQVDRIRLVYSIIEFAMKDEEADEVDDIAWGAGLNLDQLQQLDCILAHFPIHDPVYQHRIATDYTKCCTCCSKDGSDSHKVNSDTGLRLTTARLDTLRVYMGEKVALYFAFLEHFTTWMLVPAVFGVGLTIDQAGQGAIVTYAGPAFAVGIVLWATFIMESWKQKQATYAQEWGMSEFESLETPRIQFTTSESVHWVESPIDASPMPYFSPATKMFRLSMGALTMVSLFMVVIIGVWCVFMFKFWAVSVSPQTLGVFGSPLAAVLNSVQIMVMGHVWTKIADTLNDWETHRTDTEYEDHLIVKTSLFQFINHYTALFYIAFIKGAIPIIPGINQVDQCIFGGKLGPQLCDKELAQQLAIIFLTQMFVGNMTEVVVPALKQKIAKHKDEKMAREAAMKEAEGEVLLDGETKEAYVKQEKGLAELGFEADEYGMLEGMDDYLEIVVQFGYITLFVVAFPAAPFLAWMSNWLESRVDMTKLLHNARRPEPRGASDIGTWQNILIIVGNVAVLTNGALILFTSHFAAAVSFQARIWMFIGTEHIIFFIKFLADVLLPDEPEHVSLQLQRQEFVREHLIELQPYKKDSTNMRALAGKMTDEMEFAHQVAPAVVLDEDDNLDPGC